MRPKGWEIHETWPSLPHVCLLLFLCGRHSSNNEGHTIRILGLVFSWYFTRSSSIVFTRLSASSICCCCPRQSLIQIPTTHTVVQMLFLRMNSLILWFCDTLDTHRSSNRHSLLREYIASPSIFPPTWGRENKKSNLSVI
jgi:hypothetical protein